MNINQPAGVLPFDIYGGGQVKAPVDQLPLSGIISNIFGFIPTASSLDVGKSITPINDTDYRSAFIGGQPPAAPKNTPFQNFVTGFVPNNPNVSNSRHISFNTRNGNWLQTELNIATIDEITDCSFICDNVVKLTGESSMCTNGEYYSINLPPNITPTWSITQDPNVTVNLVTLINNGNSVTLKSNYWSGTVTLSATFGTGVCGSKTVSKVISIGKNINGTTLNFVNEYCDSWHYFVLERTDNTDTIDGFSNFNPPQGIFTAMPVNNGNNTYIYRLPYSYVGQGRFDILGSNDCGKFKTSFLVQPVRDCQFILPARVANPNFKIYNVFPNPSKDIVNIDLIDQNNFPDKGAKISGELFDIMGLSRSKVVINNNKAVFSVAGLPKGIYILKIYINDQMEAHQIAVE